jgi:putative tryptophan/tyrosine transport system substrate-binding protein
MRRREFISGLAFATSLIRFTSVKAQNASAPRRLGVVIMGGAYRAAVEGLQQGLQTERMEVGRHVELLVRDAVGDRAVAELAAQALERDNAVDIILAISTTATRAAKRGTSSVPIIFGVGTDPVSAGLVESFARPGGRLTGVHFLATDLTAKRLEIMREVFPEVRRVATFYDPGNLSATASLKLAQEAAPGLGIELSAIPVRSADEIREQAGALRGKVEAYFFLSDAMVSSQASIIIERTNALHLPTMGLELSLVRAGAVVGYGPDYRDYGRRPAKYVTSVLGGAKPSDLPVERINLPRLSINLKAAQAIGVSIPPALLARADEVIE